jgi:hypothetical protein
MEDTMKNIINNTIKKIGFVLAASALIFVGASSVSAEGISFHYEGEALERHRAVSGGEGN